MRFVWIGLSLIITINVFGQYNQDSLWFRTHYIKGEYQIEMRDGVKLFTTVYAPTDKSEKHPILMVRTPYSCRPYGVGNYRDIYNSYQNIYLRLGYILVYQDVRGRFMSEGSFEDIRPFMPNKQGKQTDEASDTYDTADWLVRNIDGNNGNIGVLGISYPGFYATMAALSGHPAIKAVSPQAPVTDWFVGDDFHHNGAMALLDAFGFYQVFGLPRVGPVQEYAGANRVEAPDAYRFFLKEGSIRDIKNKYFGERDKFWNDVFAHPDLDTFWASRNPIPHLKNIKPAILVVGGLYDAEDCYGAWALYKAIRSQSPETVCSIVEGPWFHGNWGGRGDGAGFGNVKFGWPTSYWYQDEREIPFFNHFLVGKATQKNWNVSDVFIGGDNQFKEYGIWPPLEAKAYNLYLGENGKLSNTKTTNKKGSDVYVSDPNRPVPYRQDIGWHRTREYMLDDQRFAAQRTDVLTYETDILMNDLTLTGPITADLFVKITGTDADFVVKVIDVFPDDFSDYDSKEVPMGGFQKLVRGEIFRGRYRTGFSTPKAFVPNKVEQVSFTLPDIAYTFKKGHRLMVQIQSSWFPLFDRNPQQFINIYSAKASDYVPITVEILRDEKYPSKIQFLKK